MLLTYYIEVNLIAVIIASILIKQTYGHTSRGESSNIVYIISLWLLIVMCVGDIAALASDGKTYPGAHTIVLIGNTVFLGAQAMLACTWLMFFQIRLKVIRKLFSLKTYLVALPIILFLIALVVNCFTGFLFTVDADNVYQRGDFIYLHWITESLYVLGAFVQLIAAIVKPKTRYHRQQYVSYLLFYIPTLAGGLWQIIHFGVSSMQVGVAISSLLVFLQIQDCQMIRDELTGLNNRRALRNYEAQLVSSGNRVKLTLFMIDLDYFKRINDTYGHVSGDEALVQIAGVLRSALSNMPGNRIIIYRYAGDEFVLAGSDMTIDHINLAKKRIQDELDMVNLSRVNPYNLSLSIGVASGSCSNSSEFDEILQKADESMYQVKTRKKRRDQTKSIEIQQS